MVDDLEVERLAGGIANCRERQHALVGGGENRIQQIILRSPLVDVGADQRTAPARRCRQRQDIVGLDQTVAHAMRHREIGIAIAHRIDRGLAERGGAIRRQRAQGNVPALVLQPFLDVAAAARYFEGAVVVPEQDDMIRQPAEAAQHHVFITRQTFAGVKCRLPLALQDGNVIEHFGVEFPGRFLHGNHHFPATQTFGPAPSNAERLNAL